MGGEENMTREEMAVGYFKNGYNCAQSTFSAFSEEFGLDKTTALRIANGLGGGVRCGEVCGAVSGAMWLNLYNQGCLLPN